MKIMASHSSASMRSETPHLNATVKRRAQSLINNKNIYAKTRAILRYGLEVNDPLLPDLVRRVDAGQSIINNQGFLQIGRRKSR
jgi:hypothetical protein